MRLLLSIIVLLFAFNAHGQRYSVMTTRTNTLSAPNALKFFTTNSPGAVNVRWFGARGDGAHDDSGNLQLAILSGHDVYIPAGTYLMKSAVALTSNTSLRGDGDRTVILQDTNMVYRSMFFAEDSDNVKVENLKFVGSGYYSHGWSFPTNHAFLYSTNAQITVRNVTITNQVNGIMSSAPRSLLIEQCEFQQPNPFGDASNYLNYLSQDIQWHDVFTWVEPPYGVSTYLASTNIVIRDNLFAGNHNCISFRANYDTNFPNTVRSRITAKVEGNTINGYGRYGIMMYLLGNAPANTPGSTNGPFAQYKDCVIRGNVIRNGSALMTVLRTAAATSYGAAIYLHAQDGLILEGNQIFDCAQYMRANTLGLGTICVGYATGVTIRGNIISNTPANGIVLNRVFGTKPSAVYGNHISHCGYTYAEGTATSGSATVASITTTNGFLTNDVIYVFTGNIFSDAATATTKVSSYTANSITLSDTLAVSGTVKLVAPTRPSPYVDTGGIYVCDANNVFIHDNIIKESYWHGIIPSNGNYPLDGVSAASNATNVFVNANMVSDYRYNGIYTMCTYADGLKISNNTIKGIGLSYAIATSGQLLDNCQYSFNTIDTAFRGIVNVNTNWQGLVIGNVFHGIASGGASRCIITGSTNCYNNLYTGSGIVTNKYW